MLDHTSYDRRPTVENIGVGPGRSLQPLPDKMYDGKATSVQSEDHIIAMATRGDSRRARSPQDVTLGDFEVQLTRQPVAAVLLVNAMSPKV